MKKTLLSTLLLVLVSVMAYAGVVNDSIYVQKVDFESGVLPEGWTQEFVDSDIYGEHPWTVESSAETDYPQAVQANGDYVLALRNSSNATIGYTTRLISPVMDLSQNKVFQPILAFSHAQQQRTGDFDQLKVYYRSKATDNWVRLDGRNGNPEFNQKIAKWQQDTILLTSQSDTYQIMFEVTDRFGRGVVLDNIHVRPMPTCEDPYGYVVSGLTTSAATVSWNASFDTDSFEVALSTAAIESVEAADPADIVWTGFLKDDAFAFSSSALDLTLKRNQLYYLYVRSYCQGAISEWTGTSFRTKNYVSLPLSVTFTPGEGWEYKSGSINHISYWSFGTSIKREDGITMEYMPFVNTLTNPGSADAGKYSFDGGFCLAFTGARALGTDIPAGQYVYAATPELNIASLKNVQVSFWGTAYQSVGPDYASGIIVGVMTDPEDFTTFVPVDTCYITESQTFNTFGVSLASYEGEGKYVAFASDFKDKANRFYMDNIQIKESAAPVWPTDIVTNHVTANGFELSLNAHGFAYNVVVAERVVNTVTGHILLNPAEIDDAKKVVTLSNQTAQQIHVDLPLSASAKLLEVYVQCVGTDGIAGDWALPVTIRPPLYLATADLPYQITWEEKENTWQERQLNPYGSSGSSSNMPQGVITVTQYAPNGHSQNSSYPSISEIYASSTDIKTATMEGKVGAHYLWFRKEYNEVVQGDPEYYGYRHKYGNYIALPQVEDLSKVLLKFYMQRYSSSVENSSRVAVGVLSDPYDISTFDTVAVFDCNSPLQYKPYSCSFAEYKGAGKIIAILAMDAENPVSGGSSGSSGYSLKSWYSSVQRIDWINLFALGECNPVANPKVEADYQSAKITWGANDMKEWIVRVKDSQNNLLDSVKVNTTEYTISTLSPHTTYTYMVSPVCDTEFALSDWLTFTTECLPGEPLPYVENFEQYKNLEISNSNNRTRQMPYCWGYPTFAHTPSAGGSTNVPTNYYPYITGSSSSAHRGSCAFYLASSSATNNLGDLWVSLPVLADSINKLQIDLWTKGNGLTYDDQLYIGTMTDGNDYSTFVVFDSIRLTGNQWQEHIKTLDSYKGVSAGHQLALMLPKGSHYYYIDDIEINYIVECEKVFTLTTSAPKVNGATFTWEKTDADQYEFVVSSEPLDNPDELIPAGSIAASETIITQQMVDTNVVIFTNDALKLNTNYYVRVRAICGSTVMPWSEQAAFKTTCEPETPEDMGVIDFTSTTALGCWTLGCMNGTSMPTRYGTATGKFKFLLRIFNTTSTDGAYAIMPPLEVEDISKYQISFDACTNSTAATNVKSITVGIISNGADLSTFAPITTITNLNYTTDSMGMFRYTVPFDSYDGDFVTGAKGNQVMFLSESGDNYNEAFIDNIRLELIAPCAAPSAVVADSVGTYGAKIAWNKTGEKYEVAITETKVSPSEENAKVIWQKETTDTFAIASDTLRMLTTYYMYVRTICGAGDTSAWSNARFFTTICPEAYTLPFSQDFETCASTGASYKPDCWTYYYVNGATITEGKTTTYPTIAAASYSHNSQKCMQLWSSNAATKTYSYAVTPYIDTKVDKAMVSFWYRANAYAAATPTRKLVVAVAEEVSTFDTLQATMTVIDTIVQTNTSSTIPYEKYARVISEKYTGDAHYIVIYSIEGNGTTSTGGMYVDDIEISLVPSCFMPDNLSAAKMYDTEAQLTWEQLQGDNTAWDVAYGLKDVEVADMTIVAADTTAFTITGLQPSTEYDFYVRANCGDGDLSEWRGPVTATTLYQIPLADAKWTFENGEIQVAQAPTGSYKKPQTWFVNNVWTGLATVGNAPYITYNSKNATGLITSNKAYSGDSLMYFYSNTTAHPGYGPYAALPVIKDADYDSLQIRFMARVTYSGTPSKVDGRDSMMYTTYAYAGGSYKRTIYVGVATDPYDMSTFEEMTQYIFPTLGTSTTNVDINKVPDPEGTNYWREVVVPLYGAKGKYIILAGPGDYNTVFVDDVIVEKVDPNACANVTKLAMDEDALKYNAAAFTWLSPKKNFRVTITEEGKETPFAQAMVDTAYFKIDTLQAQTTYTIAVQAVCGEDLSKAVELEFTTPCKPADQENASWGFVDNLYQWGTSATYVIPECWDEGLGFGSGASYTPYAIVNTTNYSYTRGDSVTDRSLRFYTTATYYNAYAVLPELDFKLDSMTLHFWGRAAYFYGSWVTNATNKNKLYAKNSTYSRTLVVGVMTDPADFETFLPLDTITYDYEWTATTAKTYDDPSGNSYWQEYALPLAKYAGKGRIAIVAPKPSAASYFFVDDIEVIKGDFCIPVTGQSASDITSTSATIRWSELPTKNTVVLKYGTDKDLADENAVVVDTLKEVSAAALTNLKPGTTYYYSLKHICDEEAGDESDWSAVTSFVTDYVVRFSENLNSVHTNLPKNWSRSSSTAAADVFSGAKTLSEADETASYAWRTSIGTDQYIYTNTTTNNAGSSSSYQYQWLITPEIDLSANTEDSLLLSFDIALRGQTTTIPNVNEGVLEQFMVIVSPDQGKTWKQEDATVWSTDIEGEFNYNNFYNKGEFLTKYIDLSKYAGQTVKIAFYSGSFADKQIAGSKNLVLLDNIQLNQYTLVESSDKICRWEDYSANGFELDADQLPAGTNLFERFTPAKKDAEKDLIERLTVVVEDEIVNEMETLVLCEGESYNSDGFSFIATQSGVYKQKLQSAIGCDSTVVLNVSVNPKQYVDIEETICQGAYFEFNGEKYYTNINKTDTLTSSLGCDSIVTLHLTVNEILKGEPEEVYLCPGMTYAFTEKYPALAEEGDYLDTVINAKGCDSVAAVTIHKASEEYTFFRAAICQGEVYDEGIFGGLRTAGDYSTPKGDQGLKTVYGCDSVVTLHLLVATPQQDQTYLITDTVSVSNLPYVLNGREILPAGTAEGVYTEKITLNCGEANLVITVGKAQGISSVYVNTLAVTPNPAAVGEPVNVLGSYSNADVEVLSATGAVVYKAQELSSQIVLPGLPAAGVYFIRLAEGDQIYQARLMVK